MQPTQPSVLLVEDDINLAKMYKIKFSKEGLEMIVANDGEQGIKVVTNKPVDVIILDMLLPKLPGNQFLEQLRALPQGKNIPVIILSNYTNKEEIEKARNFGVQEYLSKAMTTPEKLFEKVSRLVSLSRG